MPLSQNRFLSSFLSALFNKRNRKNWKENKKLIRFMVLFRNRFWKLRVLWITSKYYTELIKVCNFL